MLKTTDELVTPARSPSSGHATITVTQAFIQKLVSCRLFWHRLFLPHVMQPKQENWRFKGLKTPTHVKPAHENSETILLYAHGIIGE